MKINRRMRPGTAAAQQQHTHKHTLKFKPKIKWFQINSQFFFLLSDPKIQPNSWKTSAVHRYGELQTSAASVCVSVYMDVYKDVMAQAVRVNSYA